MSNEQVNNESVNSEVPQEQLDSVNVGDTYTAQVKWFNNTRGYGFLTVLRNQSGMLTRGPDLFVHHTKIQLSNTDCWKTLYTGESVSYTHLTLPTILLV